MSEPGRAQRSRRSKLIEFALWTLLSIVIAVALVLLSDHLLPANF